MTNTDPYFDENRPYDCRAFEIGYDLDGGGYTVDYVDGMDHEWSGCIMWNDPAWPYTDVRNSDIDLLVMDVGSYHEREWPTRVEYGGSDYFLLDEGRLNGSDHECSCRGNASFDPPDVFKHTKDLIRIVEMTNVDFDKALDFFGLEWEPDDRGHGKSVPYPDCQRCDGDGYVDSPGGPWAIYRLTDVPSTVDLRAVCEAVVELIGSVIEGTIDLSEDDDYYREPLREFMASDEGRFAKSNLAKYALSDDSDDEDILKLVEALTRGGVYLGKVRVDGWVAPLEITFEDDNCKAIVLTHGLRHMPLARVEVPHAACDS